MAEITINDLPVAVGLDGTERIPIAKNTGSGFTTEYTTTGAISGLAIQAEYLLAGPSVQLPFSRILFSDNTQITITDGGAGGNLTLALAHTAVTPGTYGDGTHVVSITVDQEGRITSATSVAVATLFQTYLQNLPTSLPAQPNIPWNNGGMVSIS